ncbi:hypothetical protein G3N95_29465 [Paraburkholderia sp. Tr-20389]|uniref:hypothetical protein n=1 Tax=Paraburkholderia sp. Tr-20389 TaxID=2703903 RepID=UPI00197F6474|nr:hypothetical protein [Paraburkholderia sp. Tr-20389]MBN3757103.1 hypothetical protein [Paraburkholderia sp. Tr-20389]
MRRNGVHEEQSMCPKKVHHCRESPVARQPAEWKNGTLKNRQRDAPKLTTVRPLTWELARFPDRPFMRAASERTMRATSR